ncbi:MAG: AmmeMemoRadiSam system protein A [Alphaproteobacteria bacterium]|nr:AmmeMemoRadiSam system protein A [Alphaproteobacteria bacterium]
MNKIILLFLIFFSNSVFAHTEHFSSQKPINYDSLKEIAFLTSKAQSHYRFKKIPKIIIMPRTYNEKNEKLFTAGFASILKARSFINNVILISSSNQDDRFGFSMTSADIWDIDDFEYKINTTLINKLRKIQGADADDAAHHEELAFEPILPYIATLLKKEVMITPLLIDNASYEQISDILDILWGGPETLVIILTDLGTAENEYDAVVPSQLALTKLNRQISKKMYSAPDLMENLIRYFSRKSVEIECFDTTYAKETGFGTFGVFETFEKKELNKYEDVFKEHSAELFDIATKSIMHGYNWGNYLRPKTDKYDKELLKKTATMVTLYKDGKIVGVSGSKEPTRSLIEDVSYNAFQAALKDRRFYPLSKKDIVKTEMTISILTSPIPLKFLDEENLLSQIQPKKDGIILRERTNKAVFLPQLWDQFEHPIDFLNHLKQAAGFDKDYFSPTIKFYKFDVLSISSGDLDSPTSIWEKK